MEATLGSQSTTAQRDGKNIFNRFYDAELFSKTEWEKRMQQLKNPPCELAALAKLHLRDVEKISGLFLK